MKRYSILGLLLCLCCTAGELQAQQSPFTFGLKGGVNLATVGGDDAELSLDRFIPTSLPIPGLNLTAEPQSKVYFGGGVTFAYAFTSLFALQAEVLYSGKGVRYDREFSFSFPGFSSISGRLKADADLSYVEIPLLVKLTLPVPGDTRPYIYAGPAISLLADKTTSAKIESSDLPAGFPSSLPVTFNVNDFDWGVAFGAGVQVRMMNTGLGLEARYTLGMQSALQSVSVQGQESRELDIKNRVLSISGFMEFYF